MSSIYRGLLAARSGLQAFGRGISTHAHNIANSVTPGFKPSRPNFSSSLLGAVGSGVLHRGNTMMSNQGTLRSTSRGLDVGISGAHSLFAHRSLAGCADDIS